MFLRLYYKYIILKLINKKLSQQRVKLFKILEKMKALAYRLKLPLIMKIYLIIFVTHLKPVLDRDLF